MEAMWTACHPVVRAAPAGSCARARFGTPRHLHAELGFVVDADPTRPDARPGARCRRPARHGHLPAHLRPPAARRGARSSRATADLSEAGIDLDVAIAGRYAGGALADA